MDSEVADAATVAHDTATRDKVWASPIFKARCCKLAQLIRNFVCDSGSRIAGLERIGPRELESMIV